VNFRLVRICHPFLEHRILHLALCPIQGGQYSSYNSDFLYHLLRSSRIQLYWKQSVPIGTIQNLNADIVRSTPVPVPSLEEQARIAAILDRFDTLTNDLTHGLPAEIAARRKQYEYYRDKLLTFPEARRDG
jgi:type I restriction enzyme S subunit